jgi:hypothetical protein
MHIKIAPSGIRQLFALAAVCRTASMLAKHKNSLNTIRSNSASSHCAGIWRRSISTLLAPDVRSRALKTATGEMSQLSSRSQRGARSRVSTPMAHAGSKPETYRCLGSDANVTSRFRRSYQLVEYFHGSSFSRKSESKRSCKAHKQIPPRTEEKRIWRSCPALIVSLVHAYNRLICQLANPLHDAFSWAHGTTVASYRPSPSLADTCPSNKITASFGTRCLTIAARVVE